MRPEPGRIAGQDRQNFWQLPVLHHYDDEVVDVVGDELCDDAHAVHGGASLEMVADDEPIAFQLAFPTSPGQDGDLVGLAALAGTAACATRSGAVGSFAALRRLMRRLGADGPRHRSGFALSPPAGVGVMACRWGLLPEHPDVLTGEERRLDDARTVSRP